MAEVEFRDGKREVPDYLAKLMSDLETHRYQYHEAVGLANQSIVRNKLNAAQKNMVAKHLRDNSI